MLPERLAVGDLFPECDASQWEAAAAKALGDESPRARLTRRNLDGLEIAGLYDEAVPSARDAVVPRSSHWSVIQEHRSPGDWPTAVREADAGGVDGHLLVIQTNDTVGDWATLLASAPNSAWFDADLRAPAWEQVERRMAASGEKVSGCLGLDPVSWAAVDRSRVGELEAEIARASKLAKTLPTSTEDLRAFAVDTGWAHRAGASDVQELALALAVGLRYLRAMEGANVDLAVASEQLLFRMHLDARFFESMAKCRALRQLWSQLLRASGVQHPTARIFARQGERGVSVLDPWINVLRSTASIFGGALGGADHVSALRYDERLAEKDPAAQRLARNTALVLREESHLARVEDPAGGAYALEAMSGDMARAAYELLREMTAHGALESVLETRWLDERIAQVRQERRTRLRTRKEPRTGVSEFPMAGETLGALGTALEDWRLDADYEELRLAADLYRAREGSSPRLTVARWGRPAEFHARQLWLENLLAAAGVRAQLEEPVESPDGFRGPSQGAPVLLCASDERLAGGGVEAVKTLRARGFSEVWVAGRPFGSPAEVEEAGAAGFVHVGIDVVHWLGRVQDALGVES